MKKIIFFILAIIGFTSCDILDVEPTGDIPQDAAFANEDAIRSTVAGCYDVLQSGSYYGRNFVVLPDLLSGNLMVTGTTQEYAEFTNNAVQSNNFIIEGLWNTIFDGINRTNMVFANINQAGLSSEKEKSYLAHCHFLRGLHYFNLVRTFGGVPIKTTPTVEVNESLNVARSSVDSVYKQINDDLDLALEYFGYGGGAIFEGAANSDVVKALLAKVKLYEEDYVAAISYATEVIENPTYDLLPNFQNLYPATLNKESVFQVVFNEQDNNLLAQYFQPVSFGGRQEFTPSDSLLNFFGEADSIRYRVSINDNSDGLFVKKYTELATRSDNVYVLRLPELYLIRAEATAELNGSITDIRDDINAVRTRTGLTATQVETIDGLMKVLEEERRKEFAFEGNYWFELVRTEMALEELSNVTSTDQYLMPIPLSEMQTNSAMTQNSGY
ncbi:MAG: RagB/SusD family nutrient uptake outer membrane protein [Salinivirgaceae bacterium]